MESATIQPSSERQDAALVSFTERYKAESFVSAAAKEIPHIGKCELSWVPNAVVAAPYSATGLDDVNMDSNVAETPTNGSRADIDYDVADDDNRWLAE